MGYDCFSFIVNGNYNFCSNLKLIVGLKYFIILNKVIDLENLGISIMDCFFCYFMIFCLYYDDGIFGIGEVGGLFWNRLYELYYQDILDKVY